MNLPPSSEPSFDSSLFDQLSSLQQSVSEFRKTYFSPLPQLNQQPPSLLPTTPLPFSLSNLVPLPRKPKLEVDLNAVSDAPALKTYEYVEPVLPSSPKGSFASKSYDDIQVTQTVSDKIVSPEKIMDSGTQISKPTPTVETTPDLQTSKALDSDTINSSNRAAGIEHRFKERQKKLDDLLNNTKGEVL